MSYAVLFDVGRLVEWVGVLNDVMLICIVRYVTHCCNECVPLDG